MIGIEPRRRIAAACSVVLPIALPISAGPPNTEKRWSRLLIVRSVHFVLSKVKAKCTARFCTVRPMEEPHDRLMIARERAGFKGPTEAAHRYHWNENTYRSHENGNRDLSKKAAQRYGKAFKVSSGWLLYGEGDGVPHDGKITTVPLVGYVGAGTETHLFSESQGPFDDIDAPEGATEDTVAVEIRGDSLGSFFDHWIVFYDDVRAPMQASLIGVLCIVGLSDGRILIKKVIRGGRRGLYTLLSQFEPPIYDVTIEWAARVKNMMPK